MSENLIPQSERTKEEQRKIARQGGVASGKARREKKAMRERLELLLEMTVKSGKGAELESIKNFASLKGKNVTVQDAMMLAQIQKALRGDTKAAEFIRDTSGQKPIEKIAHAAVDAEVLEEIEALVKHNEP